MKAWEGTKKDFRPVVKPTKPIDFKHKYHYRRSLRYLKSGANFELKEIYLQVPNVYLYSHYDTNYIDTEVTRIMFILSNTMANRVL